MLPLSRKNAPLDPDEIFLDSKNLPSFEQERLEGRIEKPLQRRNFWSLGVFLALVLGVFWYQALYLQIMKGAALAARAEQNRLRVEPLWPARGLILDRRGEVLADSKPLRAYPGGEAFAHLLGYIGYPSPEDLTRRAWGEWQYFLGKTGIEEKYEDELQGKAGTRLTEVNAEGKILSEAVSFDPVSGQNLELTVDAGLQKIIFENVKAVAQERGFKGGAAILIATETGEILSLVSYPSFDPDQVSKFLTDSSEPLFNRAVSGLYPAGSVIKPLLALAALEEGIISPEKELLSTGRLTLPNPFDPDHPSVFYDWRAHGWVDMRRALAVSSNVYFYSIGGGWGEIKGLGVRKIQEWAKKFGLGEKTGVDLPAEKEGLVPGPDQNWRIGDTYNLSIGQGNLQVTPLQLAVYAAALANGGKILKPHLLKTEHPVKLRRVLNLDPENLKVIREGMRLAVETGTAQALAGAAVKVAGKTGTAEIGSGARVNSWFLGFFPYEKPKIAMALVLEGGSARNLVGAPAASARIVQWLASNRPELLAP